MRFIQIDTKINIQYFADIAKQYELINEDIDVLFSTVEFKDTVSKRFNIMNDEYMACLDFSRKEIHIFIEPFYTQEQILHLFIHELTHYIIWKTPLLKSHFDKLKTAYNERHNVIKISDRLKDDIHDGDPEEIFCNGIAHQFIETDISRSWWRKIKKKYLDKMIGDNEFIIIK